jgi:probable selenium-dependent hydroxylase accessory protein YqeC
VASLSGWFEGLAFGRTESAKKPVVITIIGTGGKTSLIKLLARKLAAIPDRKILVTPTTKMFLPGLEENFFDHCSDGPPPNAQGGITLAGRFNQEAGKLESLPLSGLESISAAYDLVLIEGDGSRGLPLKGWADYEPVVPPFTSLTVGIIPLWPLGKPVNENIVHRLPLFFELSGAKAGEPVTMAHLAATISGPAPARSMFSAAQGKKVLLFNQIENKAALAQARELVSMLPPSFCSSLAGIAAGSVRENVMQRI